MHAADHLRYVSTHACCTAKMEEYKGLHIYGTICVVRFIELIKWERIVGFIELIEQSMNQNTFH